MSSDTLDTICRIAAAVKFFGLGIIGGLYISDSQFRYTYLLVFIFIFAGECTRVWAKGQLMKKK
ncbi:MAG: hypothetical protein PHQ35_03090 [Phycisphaerae bacterium]|nr:hypothetical protein [Phycisphaerae bacterium]MDD5380721.1 hypothetical protein [Phycisphaerae bacterium]